jgi:hypothetical protein
LFGYFALNSLQSLFLGGIDKVVIIAPKPFLILVNFGHGQSFPESEFLLSSFVLHASIPPCLILVELFAEVAQDIICTARVFLHLPHLFP